MPGKTYIKKTLFTCALLCLFAVLMGTLPEIWFRNHLKKNWNVEENTLAGTKTGRRYRLCLVLALDGVPYTMVRDLRKEGYFNGFYPPGRLVSTFPSLTRPAFSKMLIGGKPFGYERLYYNFDTHQLQGATLIQKAWWVATKGHLYPDPLRRIWEGMNDLVQHPATVLVSLKDGYAFGPPIFDQPIIDSRVGTHGAPLASHSYGFLMTDFMHVRDASRPAEVAGLLGRAAEAKKKGHKLVGLNAN